MSFTGRELVSSMPRGLIGRGTAIKSCPDVFNPVQEGYGVARPVNVTAFYCQHLRYPAYTRGDAHQSLAVDSMIAQMLMNASAARWMSSSNTACTFQQGSSFCLTGKTMVDRVDSVAIKINVLHVTKQKTSGRLWLRKETSFISTAIHPVSV